jgi:hypothetical protein
VFLSGYLAFIIAISKIMIISIYGLPLAISQKLPIWKANPEPAKFTRLKFSLFFEFQLWSIF